jgi:Flp pilus assembly protein TadD
MAVFKSVVIGAAAGWIVMASAAQAFPFGQKKAEVPAAAPSNKAMLPVDRNEALRAGPLSRSAYFARAFERNPTDAQAGIDLSHALRALGRFDEAADVAHRVLLFAPNNLEALTAAARAHIASGNGFYAIEPLDQALKLKPGDWQNWSLIGVAYDQSKRGTEAQTAWDKALSLSPENPTVLTNKAISAASGGKLAEAEALLRRAVARPEATLAMRQNLALILGLEGKMTEAEALLRRDLPPEIADANLAWLQHSLSGPANTRTWEALKAGS